MRCFFLLSVLLQGTLALLGTGSIDPLIGPDCYTVCTQSIPGTCYNPCIGTWTTGSELLPDLLHPITKETKDGNTVECDLVCAEKMAAAARALFPNVNPDLGCAGQVVCTMSIPGTCYDPCTGQTWTTGQSLMEDLIGQLKPVAP
ncbi:Hypp1824 [Branchiostoma lanceolatum]|uniref:Hypp1824 protein n=1 Tax=Branchiostoma lanceolatum TaxID=7740 RepID=A0A8J9ZN48_BRALA|nr:Hypp1824 [Branchiostoma lanceolatum]